MATGTGTITCNSAVSGIGGYSGITTGTANGIATVTGRSTIILTEASQVGFVTLDSSDSRPRLDQYAFLTMGTKPAEFDRASQITTLSLTKVAAQQEYLTSFSQIQATQYMPDTQASQIAQLQLVRSSPDRRELRAWTFTMDGHDFYVLHLGDIGTIVFDTLTRKWSEWKSEDYNIWRANCGVNWNQDIIAGSVDSNIVFQVDPNVANDLNKSIVSSITGGYPVRERNSFIVDSVMVTSSIGMSGGVVAPATMQLRSSDDYGVTWYDHGTQTFSTATPKVQVAWRSLGRVSAPGRIFELTENGAARRINSMELLSRSLS